LPRVPSGANGGAHAPGSADAGRFVADAINPSPPQALQGRHSGVFGE